MNYPTYDTPFDDTAEGLARLSRWFDNNNGMQHPDAVTWGRLAKVGEEFGEMIAAYIGATGQNPRKGVTHQMDDVVKENYDIALTALGNVEHLTGNNGHALFGFLNFVNQVVQRAKDAGMQ